VGHNLKVAVPELVAVGKIDQTEIESRIRILPDFVSSRYEERRWTRLELVAIASAAQAILAMIARMMSGYSFNEAICTQASA
jgi:glucose-6-phosphate-specific signal transduction histidine kinase